MQDKADIIQDITISVGSVCSGIEAASAAWVPLGFDFKWFSETAAFPSALLREKYPDIPNLGDMNGIPDKIASGDVADTDIICGGTPCQAFSLAGLQKGLCDARGNLTLRFVDIVEQNDLVRLGHGKPRCLVFWENVEGVLSDKTNAFGCFISSLAGLPDVLPMRKRWPNAGFLCGGKRTVVWRVLDARYFGVPQQRRRLYVVAGDPALHPERILFERTSGNIPATVPAGDGDTLVFEKEGHRFEVFRAYTDCLFSSYGTKWNGNASANNGSLFVVQDGRIRRLSPLECERLMGFPDGYTKICGAKKTNRYQVLGNSWAVPVISWIGERIAGGLSGYGASSPALPVCGDGCCFSGDGKTLLLDGEIWNCSVMPADVRTGFMRDIVSSADVPDIYLSPAGCAGIIRRSMERGTNINPRLLSVLRDGADPASGQKQYDCYRERSKTVKDRFLQVRVDKDFMIKLERLKEAYGCRTLSETIRELVEKGCPEDNCSVKD